MCLLRNKKRPPTSDFQRMDLDGLNKVNIFAPPFFLENTVLKQRFFFKDTLPGLELQLLNTGENIHCKL